MTTLVATDLDRTMIYSGGALALSMPDDQAPNLVSVEVLDRRPQSFMTVRAVQSLQRINSRATVVPVTTRTLAQYQRVRLPGLAPRFAVTSNGGHIVVDGVPDDSWNLQVRQRIARGPAGLAAVWAELRKRARGDWC